MESIVHLHKEHVFEFVLRNSAVEDFSGTFQHFYMFAVPFTYLSGGWVDSFFEIAALLNGFINKALFSSTLQSHSFALKEGKMYMRCTAIGNKVCLCNKQILLFPKYINNKDL